MDIPDLDRNDQNQARYRALCDEIEGYRSVTRPDCPLQIIAVSKTVPAHRVLPLLQCGHRDFGENRIQEAQAKWPELKQKFPDARLHIIGALQRNKVAAMLMIADYFHSLDRESLVNDLARRRDAGSRLPQLLLQVNVGNEAQKAGCSLDEVPGLVRLCRSYALPLVGMMAIPPRDCPSTPYFSMCAALARDHGLEELSMGMSGDWRPAVTLGSTWLRLGNALFGAR